MLVLSKCKRPQGAVAYTYRRSAVWFILQRNYQSYKWGRCTKLCNREHVPSCTWVNILAHSLQIKEAWCQHESLVNSLYLLQIRVLILFLQSAPQRCFKIKMNQIQNYQQKHNFPLWLRQKEKKNICMILAAVSLQSRTKTPWWFIHIAAKIFNLQLSCCWLSWPTKLLIFFQSL